MRVVVHTKRRRFVFLSGEDAEELEEMTFVQLASADLSPVPEEEWEYEEEESQGKFGFGPAPRRRIVKPQSST